MVRRAYQRRNLSIERLEPRAMLAGDVTVSVINGAAGDSLQITGDAADNEVWVDQTGLASNQYRVQSRGTLNGVSDPSGIVDQIFTLSGAAQDVNIDMDSGADKLHFGEMTVGALDIVMAAAATDRDELTLGAASATTRVDGDLTVSMGTTPGTVSHSNFVSSDNTNLSVGGNLSLLLGDTASGNTVWLFGTVGVAGDFSVNTGDAAAGAT